MSIKQLKTDPFRKGISFYVGNTSTDLCPVSAILNYLVVRGGKQGPLFLFKCGQFLTRDRLVRAIRAVLQEAGVDTSKCCSHSFRIRAATTAAARRMELSDQNFWVLAKFNIIIWITLEFQVTS